MPAQARRDHVREGAKGVYHVWSRCVQRIYLFGVDPLTRRDFSHRKQWLLQLLLLLVKVFAIDVGAFHFLSNHIHLILCIRPDIAERWTAEEIAWRWKMAWSTWNPATGSWERRVTDEDIDRVLEKGPDHIEKLRRCLMSLSWFMHRLKEPVAKLANAEMGTSGHMWAERFGCRELEGDTMSGLVYTDLQQLKCGAVDRLVDSEFASIKARIETYAQIQAQESLADFKGRKGAEHYDLSEQLLEQLIIDSCLTPFSDESPFLNHSDKLDGGLMVPEPGGLIVPEWYRETGEGSLEPTSSDVASGVRVGAESEETDVEATSSYVAGTADSIDGSEAELDSDSSNELVDSAGMFEIVESSHLTSASRTFDVSLEESFRGSIQSGDSKRKTYRRHRAFLPRLDERLKQSRPFHELSRRDYLNLVQRAAEAWRAKERERDPLHSETQAPRMGDDGSLKLLRVSLQAFDRFFEEFRREHFPQLGDRGEPPDEPPEPPNVG